MSTRGKGSKWPPEWKTFKDPVTGATIHQLTDYYCHSNHCYFTNPGWYDTATKMLFISQRENRTNLFSIDLGSGEITQLTDADPEEGEVGGPFVNPVKKEAVFQQGNAIKAIDLDSLEERTIYHRPEGFAGGGTNVTADGKYVCTALVTDLSDRIYTDMGHGYVGFREWWEAHPPSKILKIALDGSGQEVIHEEDSWIGHVNTSPSQAHLLTFCHEGPWHLVDNRIWGLDLRTNEVWKIRPTKEGESVGHEYWMPDGEHLGYHGRTLEGPIYGSIRYDNTDRIEVSFPYSSMHFHSWGLDMVVGDGDRDNPYLLLWRLVDGKYQGPKALVWHRGSYHTQRVHPHPTFSPDGKQIAYTADPQGYGQVYLVDIPEFDSLPDRDSLK